jgi:hypothetical protein
MPEEVSDQDSAPSDSTYPIPHGSKRAELEALHVISVALSSLDEKAQRRVLHSVATLLEIPLESSAPPSGMNLPSSTQAVIFSNPPYSGSDDRQLSPKQFLHEKRPSTDLDRVVCLAYYLTHYRNTPHFKTLDISKLNTEAAQIKFSNAASSVDNATKAGLLVPATKGNKQLSTPGELYVQALPDKASARAAIEGYKKRRSSRKPHSQKPTSDPDE